MNNRKSTKSALITSVIALILCFAMLFGTTFAWFTDEVVNSNNIIKTGTLELGFYYADSKADGTIDGKWITLDNRDSDYVADTTVFNYDNWEPGYVDVKYVKIANEGSLALKYNLQIVPEKEVAADAFDLASQIEVYFAETDGNAKIDRSTLVPTNPLYVGTLDTLIADGDGAAYGVLLPATTTSNFDKTLADAAKAKTGEVTACIALKMKETADNNYQGISVGDKFALKLFATQFTYENDSFDNKYDENSWTAISEKPTPDANGMVEVWTAEQLAGVMADTAGVKTINIMENINLSGRKWAPAYVSAPDLVINGNGHTISNMTTNGKEYQGFIGVAYQNITINDLTFKNAVVKSTRSFVGCVIGWPWGNADVTFNNVDVVDSEVSATLPNKAIRVGGLIGFFPYDGGNLTLNGCDVTGSTISGYHNVGAMVGTTLTQKTVTIENCSAKNNTLIYGSPNVGAFDFGAYDSGYNAYVPASGFIAENNKVVAAAIVAKADDLTAALNSGATYISLTEDIESDKVFEVTKGAEVYLDLAGKTITGTMHKSVGAVIKNNGTLTISGGIISSTAENGGSAIANSGTLTVENATLNGAPNANGSWPSYTVNNTGIMTVNDTKITSTHGSVASYGDGAVVTLNNSEIDMAGIPGFTSHGIYTYDSGKVIVNGGTYANKATDQSASGASVINGDVEVNAGTFSGRIENYYGTPVLKGGTYSEKPKAAFVAAGYKAVDNNGTYTVVEE